MNRFLAWLRAVPFPCRLIGHKWVRCTSAACQSFIGPHQMDCARCYQVGSDKEFVAQRKGRTP